MPLTPSHAVVALAFRRTSLPASAVAIGAMTPDLPLFVSFAPAYEHTHSLMWLPLTIALAALLWGLWRVAIAPAARDLSPAFLAERYPGPGGGLRALPVGASGRGRPILSTTAALVLGVLTHIVWDGFTHRSGWAVEAFPALQQSVGGTPLYSLLQDGSSVLGLIIIAIWFAGLPAVELDETARLRTRWLRLTTVIAVVAATVVCGIRAFQVGPAPWHMLFEFVTSWGLVVGIAVLVAGIAWRVLDVREPAPVV